MLAWIDKEFINLLSSQLQRFKWKSDNIACFRCPLCGDSKKKKNKTRGYFYMKTGGYFFKCHNCGAGMSFKNFLFNRDKELYKQYMFKKYQHGDEKNTSKKESKNVEKQLQSFTSGKPKFKEKRLLNKLVDSIDSLPDDHHAVEYVSDRKIPRRIWDELYYIDDFRKLYPLSKATQRALKKYEKEDLKNGTDRLLIPTYGINSQLTGVSCRDITGKSKLRYMTVRLNDELPMIYNLENVDMLKTYYVFEGQFDSMFVENSCAVGNTNLKQMERYFHKKNGVLVFDQQPRNKEVVKIINKCIDENWKVCLLPTEKYPEKDMNKLVMDGYISIDEVQKVIDENTYQGLAAKAVFAKWKKI